MEFAVKTLIFDETLPDELKKLEAEGWQLLVGTKPVVIYQVGRLPRNMAAEGGVVVDDSKITLIRGGKVVTHG